MHNTHMSQYIPPTAMHYVTGTWTKAAGAVTGTIAMHKAAGAETTVVTVPIIIPSNSITLEGAKLVSVELDYELLLDVATSVTPALYKITRGADGAALTNNNVVGSATPAAASRITADQHKLITLPTSEAWIDNDEYYLLAVSFVCGGTVTLDILGAVANFTWRIS